MMAFRIPILLSGAALGLCLCAAANSDSEPVNAGLLNVVEKSRNSEIRVAEDVDWNAFSGFRIDRATVEFRKNWARDLRQRSDIIIRETDYARIRDSMAELVDEALVRELSEDGVFEPVDDEGDGVLRLVPRVLDLDIVAPDRARNHIGGALTDSQGSMTMELDFIDTSNGVLLATTRHHLRDPYKGYMEWTTSPTNRRAARLMLERWADQLDDWLEGSRSLLAD